MTSVSFKWCDLTISCDVQRGGGTDEPPWHACYDWQMDAGNESVPEPAVDIIVEDNRETLEELALEALR